MSTDGGGAGWLRAALAAALVATAVAGYGSVLHAPFVYDDLESVVGNRSIRGGIVEALRPPADTPVAGRPVVNVTFALNYAFGGLDPAGFRLGNILIHLLAAFVLFELVTATLVRRDVLGTSPVPAHMVAAAASLLWFAHPLQTEAITYVTQRTESLAGLFYLLTVACASRALDRGRFGVWSVASIAACALGMGSKEVMVTAPLAVIAYDAVFARAQMGRPDRRWLYVGLCATWSILFALHRGMPRAASAGFGHGIGALEYLANQCEMITLYLARIVRPYPLAIDYGTPRTIPWLEAVRFALPLAALAVLTLALLRRGRAVSYLGLWFFLTLAPSSSFIPVISEVGAERRMYLALAAPILLLVASVCLAAVRWASTPSIRHAVLVVIAPLTAALVVAEVSFTHARNADYQSPLQLWESAVLARPENARARSNLGRALIDAGRPRQAEAELREALDIDPGFAAAYFNLGLIDFRDPDRERGARKAVDDFSRAVKLEPGYAAAHNNLGIALQRLGRPVDAIASFRRAVDADPDYTTAQFNLATALLDAGQADEAAAVYRRVLRLDAGYRGAHTNLGIVLAGQGRFEEALPHFASAVELAPEDPRARSNLAAVLDSLGRHDEARRELERARLAAQALSPVSDHAPQAGPDEDAFRLDVR